MENQHEKHGHPETGKIEIRDKGASNLPVGIKDHQEYGGQTKESCFEKDGEISIMGRHGKPGMLFPEIRKRRIAQDPKSPVAMSQEWA